MTRLNHASRKLLTAFALAGVVVFSACSDDDDDKAINPDATVKVINLFPDAGSVDVYNGETKINSSTLAFSEATGYISVAEGDATLNFKSTVTNNTVLSSVVKIDGGSHSVIATGTTGDNATTAIYVADDLKAPSNGKAKIRFVHASQDLAAVDFIMNDSTLFTNNAYKSATAFKEMPGGTFTVKLKVTNNGQIINETADVAVQAGKIYTFVAAGLQNPTPLVQQGLQLKQFANN